MEKFNDSSGDEEDYFFELRNFELKFFAGPHLRRFAYLSEELNLLDEQRYSAFCINLSRLLTHSRNFITNFFNDLR